MKKHLSKIIFAALMLVFLICCIKAAPISAAVGSLWSLLPPIVAIGLALITKEVYSSLFVGSLTGAVIYAASSSSGIEGVFTTVVHDGLIANLSDSYNVGILIFLVVLGTIVALMNKAGGSRAYGEWAAKHIKSKTGACISTFVLGALIDRAYLNDDISAVDDLFGSAEACHTFYHNGFLSSGKVSRNRSYRITQRQIRPQPAYALP